MEGTGHWVKKVESNCLPNLTICSLKSCRSSNFEFVTKISTCPSFCVVMFEWGSWLILKVKVVNESDNFTSNKNYDPRQ